QLRPDVDRDDVAFLKDGVVVRNAVDDDVVDGHADAPGEAVVPLEGRLGAVSADERLDQLIELAGGHARTHVGLDHLEGTGDEPPGLAQLANLVLILQLYPAPRHHPVSTTLRHKLAASMPRRPGHPALPGRPRAEALRMSKIHQMGLPHS